MIRLSSLVALLLLPLVSAAAGEASDASPTYWAALETAGYVPATSAVERTRFHRYMTRLDAFIGVLHDGLVIEPDVMRLLADVHERMMSMDVGHLYELMPHGHTGTTWRAVGARGGQENDHYVLRVADPSIEDWSPIRTGGAGPPWGSYRQFGDLGLRAFVQPAGKQSLLLASEAELGMGAFPGGNPVRALVAFIAATETHVRAAAARGRSGLEIDRAVIGSLAENFPSTVGFMQEIVSADAIVASCEPDGSVVFDILWVAKEKGMKRRYPHLAKMLRRMDKLLHASATVADDHGAVFLVTAFNEAGALARVRFRSRHGVLLPLSSASPETVVPFDLLERDRRALCLVANAGLSIMGVRLEMHGLTNRLDYAFLDEGPDVGLRVNRAPAEIKTSGRIMGLLPLWFVDLLIPSNLDRMTADFFQTLVKGRDGEGLALAVGPRPGAAPTLRVLLDVEVMSNGTLQFALNLSQRLTGGRFQVMKDLYHLVYDLWQAFMVDYRGHLAVAP